MGGPGSTIVQKLPDGETVTNNGGNLHYIYGATATNLPTSGQVSYAPVGGTRPTDSLTRRGRHADFRRQDQRGLHRGQPGAVRTDGRIQQRDLHAERVDQHPERPLLDVGHRRDFACAGGGCQPLIAGNFVGFFAGPGGAGVGLDYFFNYRGGGVIEGVSGYRRCSPAGC